MGMEGAGRRAWETRRNNDARAVRDLYRDAFASPAKAVARRRAITTLKAAGVRTVVELWGGGTSALELVAAGFRVISVDNGSMKLTDAAGVEVKAARKRRALALAGIEGGYETRWGSVAKFAHEADGALLDFCGPWSQAVRESVIASRHMLAVVVTLMTDHDISTEATTQNDRLAMYKAVLKYHASDGSAKGIVAQPCRLLCHYKRPGGQPVWVFLVAQSRIPIEHMNSNERLTINPEYRARLNAQQAAYQRERRATDPAYKAAQRARSERWIARKLAEDPDYENRKTRECRARKHAADPTYRPRGPRRQKVEA